MLWSIIKDSIPRQLLVVALIGFTCWLLGWLSLAMFLAILSVEILSFKSTVGTENDYVYSKDIFNLIFIEGDKLRVGMERYTIKDIKKIQLWQQDHYGYIDFTNNMQTPVCYKFPLDQYQQLLGWIKEHLAETTLETGFKS